MEISNRGNGTKKNNSSPNSPLVENGAASLLFAAHLLAAAAYFSFAVAVKLADPVGQKEWWENIYIFEDLGSGFSLVSLVIFEVSFLINNVSFDYNPSILLNFFLSNSHKPNLHGFSLLLSG